MAAQLRFVMNRALQIALLVIGTGIAFGFTAVVIAVSVISESRIPPGVSAGNYLTIGRETYSGEFSAISLQEVRYLKTVIPEADIAGLQTSEMILKTANGRSLSATGSVVTPNFFSVLGIDLGTGRAASPETTDTYVVISHRLWTEYYGGQNIIGEFLVPQQGTPVLITGVTDSAFTGLFSSNVDYWIVNPPSEWRRVPPIPNLTEAEKQQLIDILPNAMAVCAVSETFPISSVQRRLDRFRFSDQFVDVGGVRFHIPYADDDRLQAITGIEKNPQERQFIQTRITLIKAAIPALLIISSLATVTFLLSQGISNQRRQNLKVALGAKLSHVYSDLLLTNLAWALLVAIVTGLSSVFIARSLVTIKPFSSYLGSINTYSLLQGIFVSLLLQFLSFGCSVSYASWHLTRNFISPFAARQSRRTATVTLILRRTLVAISTVCVAAVFLVGFMYVSRASDALPDGSRHSYAVRFSQTDYRTVPDEIRAARRAIEDTFRRDPAVSSVGAAMLLPLSEMPHTPVRIRANSDRDLSRQSFPIVSVSTDFFEAVGLEVLHGRLPRQGNGSEFAVSLDAATLIGGDPEKAVGIELSFGQNEITRSGSIVGVVSNISFGRYSDESTPVIYEDLDSVQVPQSSTGFAVRYSGNAKSFTNLIKNTTWPASHILHSKATIASLFHSQFLEEHSLRILTAIISIFLIATAISAVAGLLADQVVADTYNLRVKRILGARTSDLVREYCDSFRVDTLYAVVGIGIAGYLAYKLKFATIPMIIASASHALLLVGLMLVLLTVILMNSRHYQGR